MFRRSFVSLVLMLSTVLAFSQDQDSRQPRLVLDEDVWVTFYDLPSRRFREIRTAILAGNNDAASRDLAVSANYIAVEADRASDTLRSPLQDVVARLRTQSERIENVTLQELDRLFGRVHWLLSQHYLELARKARDARDNRSTSLFLYAITHHLERALLRNNVPVTREVRATLDNLRDVAGRLQGAKTFEQAYKEKPVVRAERLLIKIGKDIDRPVLIKATPQRAGNS